MSPGTHMGGGERPAGAADALSAGYSDWAPCDWSSVCPRWPEFLLQRVQYRNAPVEKVVVCDQHLGHARAKGYVPVGQQEGGGR